MEVGLTDPQKQQILPILKDEGNQLAALKKDTKLSALQKAEKLKQVGEAIDAQISPLLSAEQQPKFKAVREELRRKLLETMAGKVEKKAEEKIESHM
jgi:predicted transcriptional regulator